MVVPHCRLAAAGDAVAYGVAIAEGHQGEGVVGQGSEVVKEDGVGGGLGEAYAGGMEEGEEVLGSGGAEVGRAVEEGEGRGDVDCGRGLAEERNLSEGEEGKGGVESGCLVVQGDGRGEGLTRGRGAGGDEGMEGGGEREEGGGGRRGEERGRGGREGRAIEEGGVERVVRRQAIAEGGGRVEETRDVDGGGVRGVGSGGRT